MKVQDPNRFAGVLASGFSVPVRPLLL